MAPLVFHGCNDNVIDSSMYVSCLDSYNSHHEFDYRHQAPIGMTNPPSWSPSKSSSLYKVHAWGAPYFLVNPQGHMAVLPHGKGTKPNEEIDLTMVIEKAVRPKSSGGLGLSPPFLVRFPDVLKDRLEKLQLAFDRAIMATAYRGSFQGVFPVKCNQNRLVVDNIVEFGKPYSFGLEAGSKPELLLAMSALCKANPRALLICNGYKDLDYVCLALLARQMGLNCVIVLEQEQELDRVLRMSGQMGVEPVIGLRAKLNTKHGGHFGDTSGEQGKFGLSCPEMVRVAQKLRRAGKLSCLQLLHFHIGSQIPSLSILKDGVSEAAHIYCEFSLMGANMKYIDIGGGLGIDYDGTNSADSDMSVGYNMEGYAREVVQAVKMACTLKGVDQPTLCSESGRALVSHHSVLVFDVLSSKERCEKLNAARGVSLAEPLEGLPEELRILQENLIGHAQALEYETALENAKQLKTKCIELFKQGQFSLMQLASINDIYDVVSTWAEQKRHEHPIFSVCKPISPDTLSCCKEDWNEVQGCCEVNHTAVYHINLSIFKSMPDTWAIGQLFPIVPLQRLEEEPKVRAILSDLTCDSDGQIARFVGERERGGKKNFLRVHELQEGKPYYMGMFLGGAYQEALGGLHNLFGSPAEVQVWRKGSGSNCWKVTKVSDGQTSADVLRIMHHEPDSMLETLRLHIQKSLNDGLINNEELATCIYHTLSSTLGSSTYLTTNHLNSSVLFKSSLAIKTPNLVSSLSHAPPPLELSYCLS